MTTPLPSDASAKALAQRGLAHARKGEFDAAIADFSEAVRLRPDLVKAHHNLGIACADCGRLEDAVRSLKKAIELEPDYADAHYNLGAVLHRLKRPEESFASYWRAYELRPRHADTLNNLGLQLVSRHRADEAVVLLQHALLLRPDSRITLNNLALAYIDVGEYDRAVQCFEQILKIDPVAPEVFSNLPTAFKESGKLKRALAHCDFALRLDPNNISVRWNRSLCLLQAGDYERGWAEYECRRHKPDHEMLSFPKPYWDGSPLNGRTLLLHAEQGRGDAIQFIRYARRIKRDGGEVVFFSPRDVSLLFANCPGIDRLVVDGKTLPKFDVHASLLSLPHLLNLPEPDNAVPYLVADPERRARWRERLAAIPGFKIGIAWQGNPKHGNDHHRSIPLRRFQPLSKISGNTLISLQRGFGTEQIRSFPPGRLVQFDRIDDDIVAFAESAALIAELPLVVTVDTSVAHLAGALGVDTLVAISTHSDWRWQVEREDNDWYPTMRLFRQRRLDDWTAVLAEIVHHVEKSNG